MSLFSPTLLRAFSLSMLLALAPIAFLVNQICAAAGAAKIFALSLFDGASNEFAQGTPLNPVEVEVNSRSGVDRANADQAKE